MHVPPFDQPREVETELKKLTEVLEKLQHRARDSRGKNLYDEVADSSHPKIVLLSQIFKILGIII